MVWGGGEVVIPGACVLKVLLPYLLTVWLAWMTVRLIGRGPRGFW